MSRRAGPCSTSRAKDTKALFKLDNGDGRYVESRARELSAKRLVPKTKGSQNGVAIGMHIRRGDRHPLEFQYQNSYIPLHMYSQVARELVDEKYNHTGAHGSEDSVAKAHSFLIVASDDPTVYESEEIAGNPAHLAQERIKLASKRDVEEARFEKNVMRKFVDETFGWEGGFFSAMFWNLGISGMNSANAGKTPDRRGAVVRDYPLEESHRTSIHDGPCRACRFQRRGHLHGQRHGLPSAGGYDGLGACHREENWINIDGGFGWMGIY